MSNITLPQQVTITLVPVVTGGLSVLGSSIIVWVLCGDWHRKMRNPKHRFLFMLCLADIVNSLCFCVWSLPIPEGTPGVWGAIGNERTCNIQGIFLQLGIMGSFYNGALALYFFLSLCRGMSDQEISKKHEAWVHIVALLWPIGTALIALHLDLYSYSGLGCWISPEPLLCHIQDDVACERGENAYLFAWLFTGIPLALIVVFILYSMWGIYNTVKDIYDKAEEHSFGVAPGGSGSIASEDPAATSTSVVTNTSTRSAKRKFAERTRETALQACWYVLAYVITHMWAFVVTLVEQLGATNPFWLLLIQQLFWPLQGFCNVFIFLRPAISSKRKANSDLSFWQAVYLAIRDFQHHSPQPSRTRPSLAHLEHRRSSLRWSNRISLDGLHEKQQSEVSSNDVVVQQRMAGSTTDQQSSRKGIVTKEDTASMNDLETGDDHIEEERSSDAGQTTTTSCY